jgi:hypothetical protein
MWAYVAVGHLEPLLFHTGVKFVIDIFACSISEFRSYGFGIICMSSKILSVGYSVTLHIQT